jgi:hypothetical protein
VPFAWRQNRIVFNKSRAYVITLKGMVGKGIDQTDDFIRRLQESRNRISSTCWRQRPGGVFA